MSGPTSSKRSAARGSERLCQAPTRHEGARHLELEALAVGTGLGFLRHHREALSTIAAARRASLRGQVILLGARRLPPYSNRPPLPQAPRRPVRSTPRRATPRRPTLRATAAMTSAAAGSSHQSRRPRSRPSRRAARPRVAAEDVLASLPLERDRPHARTDALLRASEQRHDEEARGRKGDADDAALGRLAGEQAVEGLGGGVGGEHKELDRHEDLGAGARRARRAFGRR